MGTNDDLGRAGKQLGASSSPCRSIYSCRAFRQNLFYVGYTCNPGQVDGAIYRLVSQTAGLAGLGGPYANATIILDTEGVGGPPESWEGTGAKDQGDDSFHAWQLDNGTWVGFYGTHVRELPAGQEATWKVGLVMVSDCWRVRCGPLLSHNPLQHRQQKQSDRLAGPWTRMGWLNPSDYIEKPEGIENPIVTRLTDKSYYVAVFDALMKNEIHGQEGVVGISYSEDGVRFSARPKRCAAARGGLASAGLRRRRG